MMIKTALETSIVILLLRNFGRAYLFLEARIAEIYRQSRICRLIKSLVGPFYLSYDFSYLKGLIGDIEKGGSAFLYTSRFIQWIKSLYMKLKASLTDSSNASLSGNLAESIKKEFSFYPIRVISTILVISITVNFLLTFIFQRELNIKAFFILSAFLIAGLLVLLCDADWPTVKRNSTLLRILFG